jgi:hypothetical protein
LVRNNKLIILYVFYINVITPTEASVLNDIQFFLHPLFLNNFFTSSLMIFAARILSM